MDDKVKECDNYSGVEASSYQHECIRYNAVCEEIDNCYFKQNLALKEENEKLQRMLEFKEKDFKRAMGDWSESNAEINTLEDYIKNKNIEIDTLKQKLNLAVEALHKMHSFEYDNYGMYDDDFEEQRDWLLDIACKALTKIGNVE